MPESFALTPRLPWFRGGRAYATAFAAVLLLTAAAAPLAGVLADANIVMAYLLAVALVALGLGRNPAIAAAVASVLLFDWFFVAPRFSFAVADAQYVITFGVMLAVALIIGALTARLRDEAATALAREDETRALYGLARDLAGALAVEAVAESVARFVRARAGARSVLWLPRSDDALAPVAAEGAPAGDPVIPHQVFAGGEAMPFVDRATGDAALALPLVVGGRPRGVLVIAAPARDAALGPRQRPLLDAVATLAGIVAERLHYVDVARGALVAAETQQLRNSLLAAVSHDLRTPLTVLVGHADALVAARPPLPPAQAETAAVVRDQALRMSRMVRDLLDMARLQAGRVVLRRDWQPVDDVIATSVRAAEAALPAGRAIAIDLPPDLPPVEFDAVLVERVLGNLLDNAVRHGQGTIQVRARALPAAVEIEVADEGAGVAPGTEASVFRMFEQAADGRRNAGTGMGLAIAKAIVDAHGGTIRARNTSPRGAAFAFTLPRGAPPPEPGAA